MSNLDVYVFIMFELCFVLVFSLDCVFAVLFQLLFVLMPNLDCAFYFDVDVDDVNPCAYFSYLCFLV